MENENHNWKDADPSDVIGPNFVIARFRNGYNNKWILDKLHGCITLKDYIVWIDSFGHVWDECQVKINN